MSESLTQTMQRYLQRYRTVLHQTTIAGKRQAIEPLIRAVAHVQPQIQSWNQLQRCHIDQWLQDLLYLNPSTRILRIQSVNRFFYDIIAWRWPQAPPPGLITPQDLPPRPHHLPKPLPPAVDQACRQALASIHTPAAYGVLLLRQTGMRVGEMLQLSVNALTEALPDQFTLRIPTSKTRRERIIPVSKETASLIHAVREQRPPPKRLADLPAPTAKRLMIKADGTALTYSACWRMTKGLAKLISSTENIHPHRMRHTFATEMARGGMSVPSLMKILGHDTPEMAMYYVEVAATELQNAYQSAIAQLKVLNDITPEVAPPTSLTNTDHPPAPASGLISLLIQRLESLRRDLPDPKQKRSLRCLIDRIRKTRRDLKKII
jgi:site-specific recombinase XerD